MAYGTVNAEQMTTQSGFTLGAGNASSFKNRIINGAMVIDQRNAGAASTIPTAVGAGYTLDRWRYAAPALSKFTVQQNQGSVTLPVGFSNYLGITSSAATTVAAGDVYVMQQYIEGFNTADLGWGTANAKSVNLSFQVYSSLTGTFGGSLQNSAQNRSYPFTYSISTANTWTTISITIAGDTTGTWIGATNGIGISLTFGLGVGSTYSGTANAWAGANYFSATGATSVASTNGATLNITGVQLEVGTVATSFDYRSYGTELALCQRYYQIIMTASGYSNSSSSLQCGPVFLGTMRSTPTMGKTSSLRFTDGASNFDGGTLSTFTGNNSGGNLNIGGLSGMTTFRPLILSEDNSPQGFLTASAEL
jgi:hypothetical protein